MGTYTPESTVLVERQSQLASNMFNIFLWWNLKQNYMCTHPQPNHHILSVCKAIPENPALGTASTGTALTVAFASLFMSLFHVRNPFLVWAVLNSCLLGCKLWTSKTGLLKTLRELRPITVAIISTSFKFNIISLQFADASGVSFY